jgi:hypothetical protein
VRPEGPPQVLTLLALRATKVPILTPEERQHIALNMLRAPEAMHRGRRGLGAGRPSTSRAGIKLVPYVSQFTGYAPAQARAAAALQVRCCLAS